MAKNRVTSWFRPLIVVPVLLAFAACETPASSAKDGMLNVYLVRHAEKETGDTVSMTAEKGGPLLTTAGMARAERLADILADEPITAVWSTDTNRTRATAQPTAEGHGLDIRIYDPMKPAELAELARAQTGSVLIVGHSNTIPALAGEVSGQPADGDFNDNDYESLYRVEINRAGEAVTYLLSYDALEASLSD